MAAKTQTYEDKARQIIKDNNYMVLGTCSKNGKPWANPVLYVHDDDYCFYFLSAVDSKHVENIFENQRIAVAIFDSKQKIGKSDGVEMEAKAVQVGRKDVEGVIEMYSKKIFPNSMLSPTEKYDPDSFVDPAEFRFFKVTPLHVYVTGPERRVEIDLKE